MIRWSDSSTVLEETRRKLVVETTRQINGWHRSYILVASSIILSRCPSWIMTQCKIITCPPRSFFLSKSRAAVLSLSCWLTRRNNGASFFFATAFCRSQSFCDEATALVVSTTPVVSTTIARSSCVCSNEKGRRFTVLPSRLSRVQHYSISIATHTKTNTGA